MNLRQQNGESLGACAPSLLCVNMRREWVAAEGTWIACAQALLTYARSRDWRIAHTHSPRRASARDYGPIPGLEPLTREPVFGVLGLSALHTISVRHWAEESTGPLYLIGALYGLAGAATVVDGYLLDMPVELISEACADAADRSTPDAHQERTQIGAIAQTASLWDLLGGSKVSLPLGRSEH